MEDTNADDYDYDSDLILYFLEEKPKSSTHYKYTAQQQSGIIKLYFLNRFYEEDETG